jgi:type 1 glutamine amidotransferase
VRTLLSFIVLGTILTSACAQPAQPPQKQVEQVTAALPDKAPAKPKQPRKLLIFSKTAGFRHDSIPIGVKALTLMGDKTGAYTAFATEDESFFEPEKLKTFDAVFMLNTTGNCLRPKSGDDADKREEMLKKSLADFVASGKGLAGLHSATDTYHKWKDYNKMMGGTFAGHPWHEKVPVKNVEPKHPLNAAFDGKDFEIADEIYQFTSDTAQPTERKFLLVLDVEKMKNAEKGNRKKEGPYPVSWLSAYDKGRTFYCSLGHRQEIFWNPAILKHYLAGIQYVLGDLEADGTPTAQK